MCGNDNGNTIFVTGNKGFCLDKIVEEAKLGSTEAKDITILVKEGTCYIESPIIFGKTNNNITLKAEGRVRFIGGKKLEGIKKVSDKSILERLDDSVKHKILQCNLTDNGVLKTGDFESRGFGRKVSPSHTELFVDTVPFNISQYPKKGEFTLISGYMEEEINEWGEKVGVLKSGFKYNCEHTKKWNHSKDIWVHGYWSWDWANSYERVAELNTDEMTVKTAPPYGNYAFKTGQRFYFLNILEEVTEPGDYYVDKEANMLYFYPIDGSRCEEIVVSAMDEPLIEIDGAENINIDGLTFEAVRGCALKISNSNNINIRNCTFRNIGNNAVEIKNCTNSIITGCTMHDIGDGGISVVSGDRETLTPANISVHNNHIYNIAKWSRCYQTAINITGVGISATNNLIHNCPHIAILFVGNEITIEKNEIYSVVMETGDAGAIYTGRDYTFRGNRVCGNFIHHLGGVGMGTMGIYNDDCVSGILMEDNFFYEVSRAVFLGGGRDFVVKNNVFVDCYPAIEIDGRGASTHKVWRDMVDDTMKRWFYDIGGDKSPFKERYPELEDIDGLYKQNKPIPPSADIESNIFCTERKIELTDNYEKGVFLLKSNYTCSKDDFVDFTYSDFRIKEKSAACDYGYVNVDICKIGLIEEERNDNPPQIFSSLNLDEEEGKLLLSLKNKSDKCACVKMTLYTDRHMENLPEKQFKVDLQPYEEKNIKIELTQMDEDVKVEARSDTPGVRPCRVTIGYAG